MPSAEKDVTSRLKDGDVSTSLKGTSTTTSWGLSATKDAASRLKDGGNWNSLEEVSATDERSYDEDNCLWGASIR